MSNTKLALSFRIFKNGQLVREDKLTQGVIKIGKVPSAHLRIDDESVSRMHAIIEVSGGEVSLIDLGSTRGTYVNGRKINKARLQTGDVLTLGDTRVELAISDAAELARPAPNPGTSDATRPTVAAAAAPPTARPAITAATVSAAAGELVIADTAAPRFPAPPAAAPPPLPAHAVTASKLHAAGELAITAAMPTERNAAGAPPATIRHAAAGLPLDTTPDPAAYRRAIAESADELGGARAVEVAAMLGDSVIGVKHCMDPRSGKVTPTTWGFAAAGAACLVASVIAFTASVRNASDNAHRRETWVRVDHKPERAFRPHQLGPGSDWAAFGGLALGLVGLTLALVRARGERISPYYRIGTAPGVELALDGAPLPTFPLVAPSGDDFVFNYGAGIDGELIIDGQDRPRCPRSSRPAARVRAPRPPARSRSRSRRRHGSVRAPVRRRSWSRRFRAPGATPRRSSRGSRAARWRTSPGRSCSTSPRGASCRRYRPRSPS